MSERKTKSELSIWIVRLDQVTMPDLVPAAYYSREGAEMHAKAMPGARVERVRVFTCWRGGGK